MTQGYSNVDWQAGGLMTEGTFSPTQLFTAEDDIKTNAITYLTGQKIAVLTIVALNSAGKLIPWNPAAAGVTITGGAAGQTKPAADTIPVGISAADMDTSVTGTNADAIGPLWEGGCFNPALLVWPAGLTTYAAQIAALKDAGAPFRIKRLL